MQERLTEVEIKLAHIDQSVSELSDVVYEQQKLIQRLAQTCEALQQRIQSASEAGSGSDSGDEKPPHY
jgi:SlyX protein